METRLDRNASGYYDPTAFRALKNLEKEERMSYVGKHEIWDVTLPGDKKGTVITLNVQNECATVLRMKKSAPEKNGPLFYMDKMVADAGKPSYIYTSEFVVFKRKLSGEEAAELGRVLAEAFGMKTGTRDELTELEDLRTLSKDLKAERDKLRDQLETTAADHVGHMADAEERIRSLREAVTNLKTERDRLSIQLDVYRGLYADLLGKVMEG